jgi:hypothetical protein
MSWIHVHDLVQMYRFAVENPISGALNGTAPNPVTNAQFTKELGAALHRPAMFTIPRFALTALYGEMADVLLEGQRVIPAAAADVGFEWRYPYLGDALGDLVN